jgi:Domain of unknown function (DUF222)
LEPLARPTTADDDRSAAQRHADALTELARRALEGRRLPKTGGVRPQVAVTVNLVLWCRGHHHAVHEGGWRRHRHPDATLTATPPHRRQPTAA